MKNTNACIGNVRGMTDVLPEEAAIHGRILDVLIRTLESFGYERIDVPIIEYTDLFLTKSGEDIISKMYSFSFKNRHLCLRPEFTASIGRAFVNNLQDHTLPFRLYYAGPVFRYEKPQRGRYRQFTQIGTELLGAPSPWADAEVVRCACDGLENLGLPDYHIVIGHVGVVTELLRAFELDRRAQAFLIQNLENLWKDGKGTAYVKARLREVYPSFNLAAGSSSDLIESSVPCLSGEMAPDWSALVESMSAGQMRVDSNMLQLLGEMSEGEVRRFLRDFLAQMEIGIGLGNREPEEVVERLVNKIRHRDMSAKISRAIDFLSQLSRLAGRPTETLDRVKQLLAQYDLKPEPLEQLNRLIEAMDLYGIDLGKMTLNLGMGRGLQYYTGMIFEIYHSAIATENQVCGGGRYDDLIQALGGARPVPACGFSYGLERLRLALRWEGKRPAAQVLVISVEEQDRSEACRVAQELRCLGLRVETNVRKRGVKSNLQYANRSNIPFCVIIGSNERAAGTIVIRDMRQQQEMVTSRDDLSGLAVQIENSVRDRP